MAGLARIQQRFMAVASAIATLIGLAGGRGGKAQREAMLAKGHPILAKVIKSSNPRANTPGYDYPGYGHRPTGRGATLLLMGRSTTPDSNALRLHRLDAKINMEQARKRRAAEEAAAW